MILMTLVAIACHTPEGTWKENCDPRHSLIQDSRGCTLMASCDDASSESSFTWPVSGETPNLDYKNGELLLKGNSKSCAA